MSDILCVMVDIGNQIGKISEASMYGDFISVEGTTKEGKRFSLTLAITEVENSGD